MTIHFIQMASTPSVEAARARYGSPLAGRRFEALAGNRDRLTDPEKAFIEARDGFYQASVTDTGWPYVQFRGGPAGFLKVIDDFTLGYADFRGNRQYISIGNLHADNRVGLFLMDYPNRQRLKIWARAEVIDAADDPALVAELAMPEYHATIERAVLLTIESYDWNCPRHITPRFTEDEIRETLLAPLTDELTRLQEENHALKAQLARLGSPADAR